MFHQDLHVDHLNKARTTNSLHATYNGTLLSNRSSLAPTPPMSKTNSNKKHSIKKIFSTVKSWRMMMIIRSCQWNSLSCAVCSHLPYRKQNSFLFLSFSFVVCYFEFLFLSLVKWTVLLYFWIQFFFSYSSFIHKFVS